MFERRMKVEYSWEGTMEPFRVIGNVYFVGTYQASAHFVDTGDVVIFVSDGDTLSLEIPR